MSTIPETLRLADLLEEDAIDHKEVAHCLDMRPEESLNWKHHENNLAAAKELVRLHQEIKCEERRFSELHEAYAKLDALNAQLVEALKGVLPYVATEAIGCHGYKCRESWCWSCNSEEDAEAAAIKGKLAAVKASAALAAAKGEEK